MPVQTAILSKQEKRRIHTESLKILGEVGVKFNSHRAVQILSDHGAAVEDRIVRISESLVQKALESTPKTCLLGARNSGYDLPLPASEPTYNLDGGVTYMLDFETGERRYGRLADLEPGLKVFEDMELGTVVWPPVVANDLPGHLALVGRFITSLKYTAKHLQDEIFHPREVPYFVEAVATVLGCEEEMRRRKIFSVVYCPVAPLVHDKDMSEAYLDLAPYEVPILIFPMPAAGSTGPASLFSNITLANAESLSALVLFQLNCPGTPLVMGNASGSFDFSSGAFLEGSPEMVLQTAALGEMARFYGLPNTQAGCLSDAKRPGPQAVLEKLLTTLPLVFSGVDVVQGIGALESSQMLTLEQIVVDHEIARLCRRLWEGVDFSEEKSFYRDILEAGPGGNFLMADSTVRACRGTEFLRSALLDRNTFEGWVELGRPDLYTRAKDRVRQILAAPIRNPLPDSTLHDLDALMVRADRELSQER